MEGDEQARLAAKLASYIHAQMPSTVLGRFLSLRPREAGL